VVVEGRKMGKIAERNISILSRMNSLGNAEPASAAAEPNHKFHELISIFGAGNLNPY
jgi:hypothetical protein